MDVFSSTSHQAEARKYSDMSRLQILSDLHLESPPAYDIFDIPVQAPYLALLGDIGNVRDDGLFAFIEAQLSKFQVIFFLLGNHEPYYSNWTTVQDRVKDFSDTVNKKSQLGEFVFLDQTRYDLSSDVTILGCTLHSQVTKVQEERVSFGLNDFYHIQDWAVEYHCAAHQADLAWLNHQVSEISRLDPHRKIVVFTHHSPVAGDSRATDPAHANSPISSAFTTDLAGEACWTSAQVCLWAFGHTHYNCDFVDEKTGTRVAANQRGYYFAQAYGFEVAKVVDIE